MASNYLECAVGGFFIELEDYMAVNIRVNADTRNARQELAKVERSVASIDATSKRVTKTLTRLAGGLAAAFSVTQLTRGVNQASDSLINLENRVALVTGRTDQLNKSLDNLYRIARVSRSTIGNTTDTFNRFGLALKSSGASIGDITKATESVQKALAISGGSAESASAAVFQLGQGLASGTLRGQELNSVLEQAPRIALAIADDLGVAQGALRAMAADGLITTEVVFNALLNQSEKLNSEFGDLEQTSSQALSVLGDNLKRLTGEISRVVGFTSAFTDVFNSLTNTILKSGDIFELSVYANLAEITDRFKDLKIVFEGVVNIAQAFGQRFKSVLAGIITPMRTLGDVLFYQIAANTKLSARSIENFTKVTSKIPNINKLFKAESVTEFREALDGIAKSIRDYGKFSRIFYSISDSVLSFGISLGIVNQRTLRIPTRSIKEFNFLISVALDLIKGLLSELSNISLVRSVLLSLLKLSQFFKRSFEAIKNDTKLFVSYINKTLSGMFKGVVSSAKNEMNKTVSIISNALISINDKFAWLYNEVIGNSWWTDTMQETLSLAENYLGKTSDYVREFSNNIVRAYQDAFTKSKAFALGLFSLAQEKSSSITVGIDFKAEKNSFIDDPKNYISSRLGDLFVSLTKPIAQMMAEIYKQISDIVPFLTSTLTLLLGAKLISLVSSSFEKGLLLALKGGIFAAISALLLSAFGSAFLDAKIAKDFGRSLGAAVGSFIELIIDSLPELVRALGQVAVGFGEGLAEAIGGIPGLLLKGITALPLVNLLPALLAGGAVSALTNKGPIKLLKSFAGERQKDYDLSVAQANKATKQIGANAKASAPKLSFLESVLIGRGGGRRSLAKYTAITVLADQILRNFIGNTVFTDLLFAGGLLAQIVFGRSSPAELIAKAKGVASAVKAATKLSFSQKSLAPLSNLAATSSSSISKYYQTGMEVAGNFVGRFNKFFIASQSLISNTVSSVTTAIASNWQATMFKMGRASASFANFAKRNMKLIGLAGAAAFILMASQADASTGAIEEQTQSMFQKINSAILNFATSGVGLISLMFLGSGIGGALVLKTAKALGKKVAATAAAAALANTARAGVLSLAILGQGSILAGLGVILGGVLTAIGGFALSVAAIAGSVGILAIGIFGEGDSFFDRLGNAYDSVRKFFGFSSRAASKLKGDLVDSLGSFDKLGETGISINFKPLLDSITFEDVSERDAARLRKISEKTNRILTSAQRSIEETGSLSAAETRRVKRAVDLNKLEIIKSRVKGTEDPVGDSLGGIIDISGFTKIFNQTFFGGDRDAERLLKNLGIAEATEEQIELIKSLRSAFESGIDFEIQAAASDLSPLQTSAAGRDFSAVVSQLARVTTGLNAENLSAENIESIVTALGAFSQQVTAVTRSPEIDIRSSDQTLEVLNSALTEAATKTQDQFRAAAVTAFTDIVGKFSELNEDAFDIDAEAAADRLGTKDLKDFTTQLTSLLESQTERLSLGTKVNLAPTEFRVQLAESIESESKRLADRINLVTGLADDIDEELSKLERTNVSLELFDLPSLDALINPKDFQRYTKLIKDVAVAGGDLERISRNESLGENSIEYATQRRLLQEQLQILGLIVEQDNRRNLTMTDMVGSLEEALGLVENSIKLEEALQIAPSDITDILNAAEAVSILTSQLAIMRLSGTGDVIDIKTIKEQIAEAQAELDKFLSKPDKDKKKTKKQETIFEKFVGSLSSSGFDLGIRKAASLSKSAIGSLKSPLNQIKKAQDAIVNSALDDSKARKQSLKTIKEQRDVIFDILKGQSTEVAMAGIEGLGLDSALVGQSDRTLEIGKTIAELQDKLNATAFEEFELRKSINDEITYQQQLLDGLTNTAEASSVAIRDAFSEGFKSLIKGETTIKSFFNDLLDTLSNRIIDTVVDSFVTAFFEAAGLKRMFDTLFSGLFDSFGNLGKESGENTKSTVESASEIGKSVSENIGKSLSSEGEGGFLSGIKNSLSGLFNSDSGLFGGLSSALKGIFGGLSQSIGSLFSGGGGIGSLLKLGMGFFGFSNGGIVPSYAGSTGGKDSVPAMLTPGELIVPANTIDDFIKDRSSQKSIQQSINLSITGDISRQTKQEIIKMLPTIANGVNAQNKEMNYKR